MIKKAVNSILIVAAGLAILTGAVVAKDKIIENILPAIAQPAIVQVENSAVDVTANTARERVELSSPIEKPPSETKPEAVSSPQEKPSKFTGKISAVDLNDGLFDLYLGESGVKAFHVNAKTVYKGGVTEFTSLSADMQVTVSALQKEDGSWWVVALAYEGSMEEITTNEQETKPEEGSNNNYINKEKLNVGGRVAAVGADTLTIQTKDGTPMTFAIGETTIISSYNGTHDSLDDIKVNFTVAVIYYDGDMLNGNRLAYRVVVSNEGIAFNPYQQGWVDSVSAGQFSITTNQGVSFTFTVNGSTQVKGVGSYAEITAGMRAFVYFQDDGGTLVAKGIQVWP